MSGTANISTLNELNLTWVTTPPVFEVASSNLVARFQVLMFTLRGWMTEVGTTGLLDEDICASDKRSPKRTRQELWNSRISSTTRLLDLMDKSFEKPASDYYIAEYRLKGAAIGLIVAKRQSPVYIEYLLTHPGSQGAGGILIEHIIRKSIKEWGGHGNIELDSLDEDSSFAYQALGFTMNEANCTGGGEMTLTPASSPTWKLVDGVYVLAKASVSERFIA
jgi:hypothetical protein